MNAPAFTFSVPPTHPMLAGHFPGHPIVPGAWLLATIAAGANDWLRTEAASSPAPRVAGVRMVKFTRPVRPDERCRVVFTRSADDALRFAVDVDGAPCASGTLRLAAAE